MVKKKKNNSTITMLLLLSLLVIWLYASENTQEKEVYKTSEIVNMFADGEVVEYTLDLGNGNLTLSIDGQTEPIEYRVINIEAFMEQINPHVEKYDIENTTPMTYDWVRSSGFLDYADLIISAVMLLGLFAFGYFMFAQTRGGGRGAVAVGKVKSKELPDIAKRKTFEDVAGIDEEKEELKEVVDFLKNPSKYDSLGARIPKGVLLAGPPGTGKTLLAKATAGEAGVPFFSMSGSEFIELYVGVGASRVRDLFKEAKKNSPSIIFIDEIDAVGRKRGGMAGGGGQDEREQTLNQILVEMDGFDMNEGVIVMASTNRVDVLDSALLRPGRFDRQVFVGLPDVKGREEILRVHVQGKPLAPSVELKYVAKATPGFTGADLENLINEAALMAAKKNRKAITQEDIEEATIKVIAGPEKRSKVVTPAEKNLVSYHEAGHAVATYYSPTADPVQEISIIPRGMAGGYTLSMPETDSSYTTKTQMFDQIVTLLGGRCAEKIILGDISTGASNDLERVTAIAKAMVTKYGFSDKIGNIVYDNRSNSTYGIESRTYSENVAGEIDEEIKLIVEEGYDKCMKILSEHIDQLHKVANELMETEKITGARFKAMMSGEAELEGENKEKAQEKPKRKTATKKTAEKTVEENPAQEKPKRKTTAKKPAEKTTKTTATQKSAEEKVVEEKPKRRTTAKKPATQTAKKAKEELDTQDKRTEEENS